MKNYIYLILVFGLLSCKSECFLPTDSSPCVSAWVYEKKVINNNYSYLVCFDKKGTYEAYLLDLKTGKIEIDSLNDIMTPHDYTISFDTIFFNGRPYNFECVGQDSLFFKIENRIFKFSKFNFERYTLSKKDCTKLPSHNGVGFWVQNFK